MFEHLDDMSRGLLDKWAGRPDGAAGSWMGWRHNAMSPLPPVERATRPLGWGFFADGGDVNPVWDQDLTSPVEEGGGPLHDDEASTIGGMIIPPDAPFHMHFPSYWEGMSKHEIADALAKYGRHGDTELVHVSPREQELLKRFGGAGTINPHTGLREYYGDMSGGAGAIGGIGGSGANPGGNPSGAGFSGGSSGGALNAGAQNNLGNYYGGSGGGGGNTKQVVLKDGTVMNVPKPQQPSATSSYVDPASREAMAKAGYYSPAEAVSLGLTDRSVAPQYGSGASGAYNVVKQNPITGQQYNEFQASPALVAAVMRQETGPFRNPDAALSPTGALGRMQLMPTTAADEMQKLGIPGIGDISPAK